MNFASRKVEDCFDGSMILEYRLEQEISEPFIKKLGQGLGRLDYFPHFPKPFFRILTRAGTQIRGVQSESTFQAVYPSTRREQEKEVVEKTLTDL